MQRLALSLLALAAGVTIAESRPNTTQMSCAEAAATVARAGAIVLSTGEHTYERYVATNAFCLPGESTEPAFAPTLDTPSCTVGYVCRQRQIFDNFNN